MNTYDEIQAGRYHNLVPYEYVKVPVDENTMTVRQAKEHEAEQKRLRDHQRTLHWQEDGRLRDQFRADLEEEFSVKEHPKADLLFSMAWDRGHSSGWVEVYYEYVSLVDLVR